MLGYDAMINPKEFHEGALLRTVYKLQSYKDHPDRMNEQLADYFNEFDKDKSGTLDKEELRHFLIAFFKQYKIRIPISAEFIENTFHEIDDDDNGTIEIHEL